MNKNLMKNIMTKLMMIQPGAFGDIIICAPIAKKYSDAGYDVCWPVREKFMNLVGRFDYVTPILLNEDLLHEDWLRSDTTKCLDIYNKESFDYVLNLADRGPHPTAELPHETPDQTKYRLSNMNFSERYSLDWTRDFGKENSLYSELVGDDNEYILSGTVYSDGKIELPIIPDCKVIEMDRKEDYAIFDWYKIIKNAKAIYSVESSFHCFIDGIVNEISCPKYRLKRILPEGYVRSNLGSYITVSEHWIDV